MPYCPNCQKSLDIDGAFCPHCGTKLISRPEGLLNISLGDANAISGGINVNDSHDVHNVDNSNKTYNIDKSSTIINNVTNVAAQKTEYEIYQENIAVFGELCDNVLSSSIVLSASDYATLNQRGIELGLDENDIRKIIDNSKKANEYKKSELTSRDRSSLELIKLLIVKNDKQAIESRLPLLKAMADACPEIEEVQFYFNMILASVQPRLLISYYIEKASDDYWRSFWTYVAYIKVGKRDKAEAVIQKLSLFKSYPTENELVLASLDCFVNGELLQARSLIKNAYCGYSDLLEEFVNHLQETVNSVHADSQDIKGESNSFYEMYLIQFDNPNVLARTMTYSVVIKSYNNILLAMMVTRTLLGWDTLTARLKLNQLPQKVLETSEKHKAEEYMRVLIKGQMVVDLEIKNALGEIVKV